MCHKRVQNKYDSTIINKIIDKNWNFSYYHHKLFYYESLKKNYRRNVSNLLLKRVKKKNHIKQKVSKCLSLVFLDTFSIL